MKKFQKVIGMAALSAVVLSSCVKNEESDGVKALREAQAGLIDAQSESVLANAKSVLEDVNGKYYKNLLQKYTAIEDSLDMEKYKAVSDTLKAQIAWQQQKIQIQHEIEIANINAKLEKAKVDLIKAIQDQADFQSAELQGYMTKYQELVGTIVNLETTIANDEKTINNWDNITNEYVITQQQRAIVGFEINKKYKQIEHDNKKAVLDAYKTAVADPSTVAASLSAAVTEQKQTEGAMKEKNAEVNKMYEDVEEAYDVYIASQNKRSSLNTSIVFLSGSSLSSSPIFDGVNSVSIPSYSVYYYEQQILSNIAAINVAKASLLTNNQTLADAQARYNAWNSKLSTYTSAYQTAEAAYKTAKALVVQRQEEYDAAMAYDAQYATSTASAAQTALQTATDDLNNVKQPAYAKAKTVFDEAVVEVANVQAAINSATAAASSNNAIIEEQTAKKTENESKKASATTLLASLKTKFAAAVTTEETNRLAYLAVLDAYTELNVAYVALSNKNTDLRTLVTSLENLAAGISTDYKALEDGVSALAAAVEAINKQITDANELIKEANNGIVFNNASKATLQAKVDGYKQSLAAYKLELARYYGLMEAAIK